MVSIIVAYFVVQSTVAVAAASSYSLYKSGQTRIKVELGLQI